MLVQIYRHFPVVTFLTKFDILVLTKHDRCLRTDEFSSQILCLISFITYKRETYLILNFIPWTSRVIIKILYCILLSGFYPSIQLAYLEPYFECFFFAIPYPIFILILSSENYSV